MVNSKLSDTWFVYLSCKNKQFISILGIDQKSFAFACEIGRTQLYMIENGKTNPRLLTLMKIADGLEISIDALLKFN